MKLRIYNTVKAIIFNADDVLLIKKEYEGGRTLYTLPGGSQNPGETLEDTLHREIREEIDARVTILDLAQVYEYRQNSKTDPELVKHKVEFAFHCQIIGPYKATMGVHPDPHQTDVVWINRWSLNKINLYPVELKDILLQDTIHRRGVYLGEISNK